MGQQAQRYFGHPSLRSDPDAWRVGQDPDAGGWLELQQLIPNAVEGALVQFQDSSGGHQVERVGHECRAYGEPDRSAADECTSTAALCAGFLEDCVYERLRSPGRDFALALWGVSANVSEDDHCLPSQDDGER